MDFVARLQGDLNGNYLEHNRAGGTDPGAIPQDRHQHHLGRASADPGAVLHRNGRRRSDRTVLESLLRHFPGADIRRYRPPRSAARARELHRQWQFGHPLPGHAGGPKSGHVGHPPRADQTRLPRWPALRLVWRRNTEPGTGEHSRDDSPSGGSIRARSNGVCRSPSSRT